MIRQLVGLLGIVTALFPERIVGVFEAVAIDNPDECATKQWISSGIRVEGLLVTMASLIGRRAYAWMMNLTGAFGAVVLLSPQLYRQFASNLLFEDPGDVEWNGHFDIVVRIIGIVYVLLAIRESQKRRASD